MSLGTPLPSVNQYRLPISYLTKKDKDQHGVTLKNPLDDYRVPLYYEKTINNPAV